MSLYLNVQNNMSKLFLIQLLCRYDSDDTPMSFYLNVHDTLENRRKEANDEGKGHGPRTIVRSPVLRQCTPAMQGQLRCWRILGRFQLAVLAGLSLTATSPTTAAASGRQVNCPGHVYCQPACRWSCGHGTAVMLAVLLTHVLAYPKREGGLMLLQRKCVCPWRTCYTQCLGLAYCLPPGGFVWA